MEIGAVEIWTILGVLLLVAEILAVSFFFMFFGVGALATALFTYLGICPDLFSQLVVFALVSVSSILLFRKQVLELFHKKGENFKEIIDEKATVSTEIPQNGTGKVFYRGADWLAESIDNQAIASGVTVKIKKIDGIKLLVSSF